MSAVLADLLRRACAPGVPTEQRDQMLSGIKLSGVDLRRADLSGANLRDANLSGANLWRAHLWGAHLRGADLRDANLSGADLWSGVASLGPTPSGDVVIYPTPGGWVMQVGCWRGSPDGLRALIARDDGWPEARGEEVARRRPWLEIALAHADLVMVENPGLIGVLSAQWGSPDDRRAES